MEQIVHQNNICWRIVRWFSSENWGLKTNRSKETNMSGSQTRAFQGGSPEPKKKKRNADDIDLEPVCLLWIGLIPQKKQGLVQSNQGPFMGSQTSYFTHATLGSKNTTGRIAEEPCRSGSALIIQLDLEASGTVWTHWNIACWMARDL